MTDIPEPISDFCRESALGSLAPTKKTLSLLLLLACRQSFAAEVLLTAETAEEDEVQEIPIKFCHFCHLSLLF